jgi:DNA-binding FrmR family transcriptional regulator
MLTQVSAATKALQQVALALLDDHLRHCVREAARTDPDAGATELDEVSLELGRLLRI